MCVCVCVRERERERERGERERERAGIKAEIKKAQFLVVDEEWTDIF